VDPAPIVEVNRDFYVHFQVGWDPLISTVLQRCSQLCRSKRGRVCPPMWPSLRSGVRDVHFEEIRAQKSEG